MTAKAALAKALLDGRVLIDKYNKSNSLQERLLLADEYISIINKLPKEQPKILQYPNYPDYEIFENIDGYEGIYQIGNFGTFKSLEGFFIKNKKGSKEKMAVYKPLQIRKPSYHQFGYPRISLWDNGKAEYFSIHRLVGVYFLPNPNNYPQVLHKDDNPKNPHWKNLEWGTQSKNIQDAADRDRGFRGVKNGMAKLSESDIPKIRELISQGLSSRVIGLQFNIAKSQILSIKNNLIWKHIN